MSRVAAANPDAWNREAVGADIAFQNSCAATTRSPIENHA